MALHPAHLLIPKILIQTKGPAPMVKDDLTYRIIGCAMKVHNTLGNGFQEVIYQRCLAIEMDRAGIDFGREVAQAIY